MEASAFGAMLTNHIQDVADKTEAVESAFHRHGVVLAIFSSLLVLMVVLLRFGKRILGYNAGESGLAGSADISAEAAQTLAREEKAFAEFAASFRTGPRVIETPQPEQKKPAEPARATVTAAPPAIVAPVSTADFLSWAPGRIARCRTFLPELGRIAGEDGRKRVIGEMNDHVQALKSAATHPDLISCWKVISSLEGLLRYLAEKPATLNPSILHTLAGSIDLLDRLCDAGPSADLLNAPAVRFLAVDDDAICRHTVSFALKRALNAPELAENGTTALTLTEANAYDAIFLDVQMPGMDGFELCRKIRAGNLNRSTPIAFITCQSDFNSRAQSSLAGGCDLIGKPFVTFEVTAKALVLALTYRLNKLKPLAAQAA